VGTFTTKLRIWNPAHPDRVEELEAWVDTGAAYSWIGRSRLEALGIAPVRRMQFRTIDGKTLDREMAPVFLATDGYIGGDNVVMAESGELEVLGAHSLESLGLTVDPVQKKLLPQKIALALTTFKIEK